MPAAPGIMARGSARPARGAEPPGSAPASRRSVARIKRELFCYAGGHGAALHDDRNLRRIIDYSVNGTDAGDRKLAGHELAMLSRLSRALGALAWVILVVLLAVVWWLSGPIGGYLSATTSMAPPLARACALAVILAVGAVFLKIL